MSPPWRLEPDALIVGETISEDLQTQNLALAVPLSIAISLKRIADTLQIGQPGPTTIGDLLQNISDGMPS